MSALYGMTLEPFPVEQPPEDCNWWCRIKGGFTIPRVKDYLFPPRSKYMDNGILSGIWNTANTLQRQPIVPGYLGDIGNGIGSIYGEVRDGAGNVIEVAGRAATGVGIGIVLVGGIAAYALLKVK